MGAGARWAKLTLMEAIAAGSAALKPLVVAAALLVSATFVPAANACVLTLDAKANGKTVPARVGDRIVLTLTANASTGYAWVFKSRGTAVLRLDSARYVPAAKPGLVGVSGRYVARFAVRAAGRAKIELVYVRHTRPPTPPAARFVFTVVSTRH